MLEILRVTSLMTSDPDSVWHHGHHLVRKSSELEDTRTSRDPASYPGMLAQRHESSRHITDTFHLSTMDHSVLVALAEQGLN